MRDRWRGRWWGGLFGRGSKGLENVELGEFAVVRIGDGVVGTGERKDAETRGVEKKAHQHARTHGWVQREVGGDGRGQAHYAE